MLGFLVPDSLHLPLDDDLAEINGETLLLDGGGGREPEPLDGGDDVLDEVVPHRVVYLEQGWFNNSNS